MMDFMAILTEYLTRVIYYIVYNSPSTTITLFAMLGFLLVINMFWEISKKAMRGLVFMFALGIYLPYCFIRDRLSRRKSK